MKKYSRILLKQIVSKQGNKWNIYDEYKGKYSNLLIIRKKDGLVLTWEYYGPYVDVEQPIQHNIKAIESGINLKEFYQYS